MKFFHRHDSRQYLNKGPGPTRALRNAVLTLIAVCAGLLIAATVSWHTQEHAEPITPVMKYHVYIRITPDGYDEWSDADFEFESKEDHVKPDRLTPNDWSNMANTLLGYANHERGVLDSEQAAKVADQKDRGQKLPTSP